MYDSVVANSWKWKYALHDALKCYQIYLHFFCAISTAIRSYFPFPGIESKRVGLRILLQCMALHPSSPFLKHMSHSPSLRSSYGGKVWVSPQWNMIQALQNEYQVRV